jgi:hypothetical protein
MSVGGSRGRGHTAAEFCNTAASYALGFRSSNSTSAVSRYIASAVSSASDSNSTPTDVSQHRAACNCSSCPHSSSGDIRSGFLQQHECFGGPSIMLHANNTCARSGPAITRRARPRAARVRGRCRIVSVQPIVILLSTNFCRLILPPDTFSAAPFARISAQPRHVGVRPLAHSKIPGSQCNVID